MIFAYIKLKRLYQFALFGLKIFGNLWFHKKNRLNQGRLDRLPYYQLKKGGQTQPCNREVNMETLNRNVSTFNNRSSLGLQKGMNYQQNFAKRRSDDPSRGREEQTVTKSTTVENRPGLVPREKREREQRTHLQTRESGLQKLFHQKIKAGNKQFSINQFQFSF